MNNATLESAWVSTYPKRRENVKAWSTVGMLLPVYALLTLAPLMFHRMDRVPADKACVVSSCPLHPPRIAYFAPLPQTTANFTNKEWHGPDTFQWRRQAERKRASYSSPSSHF
jgi:hypothetical protein